MNDKSRLLGTILGIVIFILIVAGFTYAALNWRSGKVNLGITSGCFDIYYDKGQDISGQLNPSSSYTDGLFATIKINIKNSCTTNGTGTLYLETLSTTSSNLYRTGLLNYQVVKDGIATNLKGNITKSGEIALDIGTLTKASSASTTYKIYVWVDKEVVISSEEEIPSEVIEETKQIVPEVIKAEPVKSLEEILEKEKLALEEKPVKEETKEVIKEEAKTEEKKNKRIELDW